MTKYETIYAVTIYLLEKFSLYLGWFLLWVLLSVYLINVEFSYPFWISISLCAAVIETLIFWLMPRKSFGDKRKIVEILRGE